MSATIRGIGRRCAFGALAISVAGCTSTASPRPSRSSAPGAAVAASPSAPEPQTSVALIAIAQRFNDDYGANNDGPVYDRWDARSQALISRADYLKRHLECNTAPQAPAHVVSAAPDGSGAWLVHYVIDGMPFTDYWFYAAGRWVFDIILSNPSSARLYRLSFTDYASAMGCAHR
jgi:hypothetical protein